MRIFRLLFLFLVSVLALFVSITGILAKLDLPARIFQFLFVPVTFYLVVSLISHLLNRASLLDKSNNWKRLIIYYCFIVTSTLVVISFFASDTLAELISSAVFSPLAIYFLIMVLPRTNRAIEVPVIPEPPPEVKPEPVVETTPKLDENRRDFLKLIGTAGILAFIFSIFSKRTSIPFFANYNELGSISVKDTTGSNIDPAEKSPTDGYYISEIDDATDTSYFGFVNTNSQWYIMRQEADGTIRYVRGNENLSGNWTKRENLNYDYFDKVFVY